MEKQDSTDLLREYSRYWKNKLEERKKKYLRINFKNKYFFKIYQHEIYS